MLSFNSTTVASFNSTGLSASRMDYISEVLSNHKIDILLLQETWLGSKTMDKLSNIHKDYLYHGISGMDENELIMGRPHGGIGILWRKEFGLLIKPISVKDSKRICAVSVSAGSNRILIINCYMPVDNYSKHHVTDEFSDSIDTIENIILCHPDHQVILGGDINVDIARQNAHDQYYCDLLQRQLLTDVILLPDCSINYTYSDLNSGAKSCIDHFALSRNLTQSFRSGYILDQGCNPSNHKPVIIDLDVEISQTVTNIRPQGSSRNTSVAWHKVAANDNFVKQYQHELDNKLLHLPYRQVSTCQDQLCSDESHREQIDLWCEDLIEICLSSEHVLPQTKHFTRTKAGWNHYVRPYKDECNFWYISWKTAGKPRNGPLYELMREAKRQYMYAVRRIKRKQDTLQMEKLSQCILEK